MPVIHYQKSVVPWYLFNRHLQTIVSTTYRNVLPVPYVRERIETPDDDFLDLDWSKVGSKTLVIILHGLTGNSHRNYVFGMARAVNRAGFDALGFNCRSSSGEMNRKLRAFHSGWTRDISFVVEQIVEKHDYENIFLVGFSMGGNISLKYAGQKSEDIPKQLKGIVAFSVPLNLQSGAKRIDEPDNGIYRRRFLRRLKELVAAKAIQFPDAFNTAGMQEVETLAEFDQLFTAPVYGFRDPEHFYEDSGAVKYLSGIRIPSLIVTSSNDPFIGPESLPEKLCTELDQVTLFITRNGGHVGFGKKVDGSQIWSEAKAVSFIKEVLG